MPEIAEVAVYAHDLNKLIEGKKLKQVEFKGESRWKSVIVPKEVQSLIKSWEDGEVSFHSLGKTLYLNSLTNGAESKIQFKLGMTGMFQVNEPSLEVINRHAFIVFEFSSEETKSLRIYYLDYRRFGRLSLAKDEPLAIAGFNGADFFIKKRSELKLIVAKLKNFNKKPRISWLLEHGVKTGVGNYLANEALGQLDLSPFDVCVNESEAVDLLVEVTKIAKKSFKHGGNSFKGGYYRLTGELGDFFAHCQYYRNIKMKHFNYRGRPVYTNFDPPKDLKVARKF